MRSGPHHSLHPEPLLASASRPGDRSLWREVFLTKLQENGEEEKPGAFTERLRHVCHFENHLNCVSHSPASIL